jgi:hypothetical protein
MLIPWIPYGIPDGFLGFQVDSIWNNLGKVKTLVTDVKYPGYQLIDLFNRLSRLG